MDGCGEERDPDTGAVIFRGLRVRMGMSWGKASSKKPLNTGRADYFGVLPNGAARVMGLASPGQVGAPASWVNGWCCLQPVECVQLQNTAREAAFSIST